MVGGTAIAFPAPTLSTTYGQKTALYYPVQEVATSRLIVIGTCMAAGSKTVYFDDVTMTIEGFYPPAS